MNARSKRSGNCGTPTGVYITMGLRALAIVCYCLIVCASAFAAQNMPCGNTSLADHPNLMLGTDGKPVWFSHVQMRAMATHKVVPAMPGGYWRARFEGQVDLAAVIGADGNVECLRSVTGPPMLIGAAIDAAKQWKFRVPTYKAKPAEFIGTIRLYFSGSKGNHY